MSGMMIPDPRMTPGMAVPQGAGVGMPPTPPGGDGAPPDEPPVSPGGAGAGPRRDEPFSEQQFQEIYTLLKALAQSQGVPSAEASELAQETMYRWTVLHDRMMGVLRFESDAKRRAWARKIFGYVLSRYFEGRRKSGAELPEELPGSDPTPSTILARNTLKAVVDAMIAQLHPAERRAVRWYMEEDCKYAEIGRRLNVSDVRARKILLQALEKLARLLIDFDPNHPGGKG